MIIVIIHLTRRKQVTSENQCITYFVNRVSVNRNAIKNVITNIIGLKKIFQSKIENTTTIKINYESCK